MEKTKIVRLRELRLKNYKGLREQTVPFAQRTYIGGKNAVGKTTIMDAYFDILTGKTADGKTASNIRPHDFNGIDIDRIPVDRALTANINGKSTDIIKVTEQKWVKPRGQEEEEFSGNSTSYKINGFDKKAKDYDAFIASNIADSETLLMCSNATPFLNLLQKSTTEARKLLERLTGFSVESFIEGRPEYKDITDITDGNSIEDTIKQLKRNLSAQKKEVEKKQTELSYETDRDNSNEEQTEALKAEYEILIKRYKETLQKLASIDKTAYEGLLAKVQEINASKEAYITEESKDFYERRAEVEKTKHEYENREAELAKTIQAISFEIEVIDRNRADTRRLVIDLQRDHAETGEKLILNSVCPYCGQELPEDKKDSISEKNRQITIRLNELSQKIEDLERYLESSAREREVQEKLLAEKRVEKSGIQVKIFDCQKALDEMTAPDFTRHIVYQKLLTQEEELRSQLAAYNEAKEDEEALKAVADELRAKIEANKAKTENAMEFLADKEKRLESLHRALRNEGQRCADIERQIDRVQEFSIAKNQALADMINPHFKHFHFEFLEYTQEGNPVETCKLVHNGTSYFEGLNGGDKKLVELYLVAGLQELNNLCLPIWVDEANIIDPYRIPDNLEQQLIIIQRTDDEDINVKGE